MVIGLLDPVGQHQDLAIGLAQDVRGLLGPVAHVDRYGDGTHRGRSEVQGHPLDGVGQPDAHLGSRLQPESQQPSGGDAHPRLEIGVGVGIVAEDDRPLFRQATRHLLEDRAHRPRPEAIGHQGGSLVGWMVRVLLSCGCYCKPVLPGQYERVLVKDRFSAPMQAEARDWLDRCHVLVHEFETLVFEAEQDAPFNDRWPRPRGVAGGRAEFLRRHQRRTNSQRRPASG